METFRKPNIYSRTKLYGKLRYFASWTHTLLLIDIKSVMILLVARLDLSNHYNLHFREAAPRSCNCNNTKYPLPLWGRRFFYPQKLRF